MAEEKNNIPSQQNAQSGSAQSVPERIWKFLTAEKGLGSVTAASIMGNIAQESMYNTNAVSSDGHESIGICQWTDSRKDNLINFAQSIGKSHLDLEAQLQFLWKEIEAGGYIAPMHTASSSKSTPEEQIAAEVEAFCFGFERPAREYANLPNRIKYAMEAYQKQGKGILAAGTYIPSNNPANGALGQTSVAKRGTVPERIGTEKQGHVDEWKVKPLDPDKTFCEPIYPDLTSIGEEIPAYAIPPNMPESKMNLVDYKKAGAGLVFELPTESIVETTGNTDLLAFNVYNQNIAEQRKEIFDIKKHRNAIKVPSAGKPPNNADPFPVDKKIVELETHQPRCKIESVLACRHSIEVGKALVVLSTDTEKRLVRLENNMATIMRYLYRLASRININCVYYGGQSLYNKYNCIRCLRDDRVQEGAEMTLDQCLNCNRYEPLIGQVYDIYNDYAINLSQVLDDNQMSYTNMNEYVKFTRAQERQIPMEAGNLDSSNVKTRNKAEIDFNDEWGPGLAMDWSLYPVELQRPHTNPPTISDLASSNALNSGMALTNGGNCANMLIEARNQIDASTGSNAKSVGSDYIAGGIADTLAAEFKAKQGENIRNYYKSKGITQGQDPCLILCLMHIYGSEVGSTIDKFESIKSELKGSGVDNICLHVMFYSMDKKYLLGEGDDSSLPNRLDKVTKKESVSVPSGSSTGTRDAANNSETTTTTENIGMGLSWDNVKNWNWNDFSEPLAMNITGQEKVTSIPNDMLNFVKIVYLYKELIGKCSASRFDTAEWGFPFTEEEITGGYGLNYSSPFGPRNIPESSNTFHGGIDIGVGSGANAGDPGSNRGVPIHAARDGVVTAVYGIDGNGGGNRVYLQHDNGWTSWYMHMVRTAATVGQKVSRGEVIGYTGGSGSSGQGVYDEHLHFEIHQPGEVKIDPASCYNGLSRVFKNQLDA